MITTVVSEMLGSTIRAGIAVPAQSGCATLENRLQSPTLIQRNGVAIQRRAREDNKRVLLGHGAIFG